MTAFQGETCPNTILKDMENQNIVNGNEDFKEMN